MTTAMDAIDWAALGHAYGPATDTPDLIRDLRSEDADRAGAALSELWGSVNHQGTVYPATVAAVPFLVGAALHAVHRRADLVSWIGMLADPHHSYGEDLPAVQAAVREHAGPLTALLHDDDQEVRAAVVYLAAQTGAVSAAELLGLWDTDVDTGMRVALVFALAVRDPETCASALSEALHDDEPEVRLAAALALLRAGVPWPDGAADLLVDVFEEEPALDYCWQSSSEPTTELVLDAPEPARDDLLTRLLKAPSASVRCTALWIMGELFQARRGPRERFMPLLAPLLTDPHTCEDAVDLLRKGGRAAGCYRDDLAAIAAGYPERAMEQGFTAELYAVQALIRLGDPRWVRFACEGARAGGRHHTGHGAAPCNAETLAAVRARLEALPAGEVSAADRAELATLLTAVVRWGEAAVELVTHLRELVPAYGAEVAAVLATMGDDTSEVVDCLRVAAVDGSVAEAVSLWRLTGEAESVGAAVRRQLEFLHRAGSEDVPDGAARYDVARGLRDAVPAGADLRDLADDIRTVATGEQHHAQLRLTAARLLWAATGETEVPLAVVRHCLEDRPAARFVIPEATELTRLMHAETLIEAVRPWLDDDGSAGVAAARTLWVFGMSPDDLMPCLRRCVQSGWPNAAVEAVNLIVEMGHSDAVTYLQELVERDEAVVMAGVEPDPVWHDEELRDRMRAAVAGLRAS